VIVTRNPDVCQDTVVSCQDRVRYAGRTQADGIATTTQSSSGRDSTRVPRVAIQALVILHWHSGSAGRIMPSLHSSWGGLVDVGG
jgi:hypothetical protein